MKKRASAAVQKAMAGCLTSLVILAVLAGLAMAVLETHLSGGAAQAASIPPLRKVREGTGYLHAKKLSELLESRMKF